MQKTTYHISEKPEISLQTFEVGLVMAAVMMRVTAVTLIIPFPVTPSGDGDLINSDFHLLYTGLYH